MTPENYASVDIGSNAVRLLFSSVYEKPDGVVVSEKATLVRIPVRLGMDVFETGSISPHREQMLLKTLEAFRLLIGVYEPVSYRACATAAMREASNSAEVISAILDHTGLEVEVIDGRTEAELISSCNGFMHSRGSGLQLFVDVGGGSTELSLLRNRNFIASTSLNVGTIRLLSNHVEDRTWKAMKRWIKNHVPSKEKVSCIGSGGNINKLVKLFGNTNQRAITWDQLKAAHRVLSVMDLESRVNHYGMRFDRADVIVPAAEIFLKIMKWGGFKRVTAPRLGLADGLAIAQYRAHQAHKSVESTEPPPPSA
jgi:exopolyphosphatase / guanosine-5'-triphosphate,3'-diphosphate pyrophosphatase